MGRIRRHTISLDATGQSPGRLASVIAQHLSGKWRVSYRPERDGGQKVVVKNAALVAWTGKKRTDKVYIHHTMHPGGLKVTPLNRLAALKPEAAIRQAVVKMLPKNKFRSPRLRRLRFI